MGGSTITKVGDNVDDLLKEMEKQIIAASKLGLWADSGLIIIDPWKGVVRIFKVEYAPLGTKVIYTEVEEAPAFHVGIAANYGPHPEADQIVATVHVHS